VCLLSFPITERLQQINILINPPDFLEEYTNQLSSRSKHVMDLFLSTKDLGGLFFNIFLLAFLPAISEEFFFRGVFQSILIKKTNRILFSVILTSFIFAFFHLQFFNIMPIFYAGVVLGFLYLWTSSIWVPVFFHFTFNAFQIIIEFVSKGEIEYIMNNNNYYLAICLIGVGSLLYLFKNTFKNQSSFFVE
jgi:membrane protease YdiL (CAAX protease family)